MVEGEGPRLPPAAGQVARPLGDGDLAAGSDQGTPPPLDLDPEELTDEELGQAMDELGIEKQEVTDADQEA